jgi:hypothetical protein
MGKEVTTMEETRYFVSYHFVSAYGSSFGNKELRLPYRIEGEDEIQSIEEEIRKLIGGDAPSSSPVAVTVIYWKEFEK